jgi:hypothetical protein
MSFARREGEPVVKKRIVRRAVTTVFSEAHLDDRPVPVRRVLLQDSYVFVVIQPGLFSRASRVGAIRDRWESLSKLLTKESNHVSRQV